jgi:hypothetical protein
MTLDVVYEFFFVKYSLHVCIPLLVILVFQRKVFDNLEHQSLPETPITAKIDLDAEHPILSDAALVTLSSKYFQAPD